MACSLLLALSNVMVAANGDVVEIQLVEMIQSDSLGGGDSPLDSHGEVGSDPTDPTTFRAFLSGRNVFVSHSGATLPTQLIIKDNVGGVIVNHSFIQNTAAQMPTAGSYTLELHTTASVLQGYFEVRE